MKTFQPIILLLTIMFLSGSCVTEAKQLVNIILHEESAQLRFAASKLEIALLKRGYEVSFSPKSQLTISLGNHPSVAKPNRGFVIHHSSHCKITGSNHTETMYGGLELAEQLRLGKLIFADGTTQQAPYIEKRGIKFNIPLDARTPSYDDSGDAAQRNIAEMWNIDFWTEFLDQLACDRYNMLSLWNPHPFPSMIQSDKFPKVALDNVKVTTLTPNGRENEWGEPQLVSSNVIANLRTVKQIKIREKINYWQTVLQHAENRGIDVYFITWNICPNSVAKSVQPYYRTYDSAVNTQEIPGKYGVTHEIDNLLTIKYMRDAVKTFLLTYPTVKGIGVTSGEHMPISSEQDREKWMWETYAKGIIDVKKLHPKRKVNFIHRVWNTDLETIMTRWNDYPDSFTLGFKYAKARLYSSPKPPFANGLIKAMKPHGLKAWWNLRNDDIFVHRWGDPDYVRQFIRHFNLGSTAGFHMGSDGYVWGREFVSKSPKSPRELEIHKHWFNYMLWGRLGYNPDLDKDFFIARLEERFPTVEASALYKTWQTASKIIPLVNRFHWRDWDHHWSVENSNSHGDGFRGVEAFAKNRTMNESGLIGIEDYVDNLLNHADHKGTTPIQVADQLDELSKASLIGSSKIKGHADSDLTATVDDIRGMAWLGQYYADKIRAAVSLTLFRRTGDKKHHQQAIKEISAAYEACTTYVDHSQNRYHPQTLARTGRFDWSAMLNNARKDVSLVKQARAPIALED